MSKTALKKELANMSREQLEQIILDAYDSSKETKAYFDFFLNPDIKKLREKMFEIVCKELRRQKWGYCKGRVSVLKKAIKDFAGYKPGPQEVLLFMFNVLMQLGVAERFYNLSDAQERYISTLTAEILTYANSNQCADYAIELLNKIINSTNFREYFRKLVDGVLNQ